GGAIGSGLHHEGGHGVGEPAVALFAPGERFDRLLAVVDIDGGDNPGAELPVFVAVAEAAAEVPAVLAIGAAKPEFELDIAGEFPGFVGSLHPGEVFGVDGVAPASEERFLGGEPGVVVPALVEVEGIAAGCGLGDDGGHGFGANTRAAAGLVFDELGDRRFGAVRAGAGLLHGEPEGLAVVDGVDERFEVALAAVAFFGHVYDDTLRRGGSCRDAGPRGPERFFHGLARERIGAGV